MDSVSCVARLRFWSIRKDKVQQNCFFAANLPTRKLTAGFNGSVFQQINRGGGEWTDRKTTDDVNGRPDWQETREKWGCWGI
jgi:hypothetical protein